MTYARILIAFTLASPPGAALAHGTSKSFADWTIDDRVAELSLGIAAHDLIAAVEGLDADADRALSAGELDDRAEEIGRRVASALEVSSGEASFRACRPDRRLDVKGVPDGRTIEEVQIHGTWVCDGPIRRIRVRADLLPELEPPHVSVATFTAGDETAQHIFSALRPESVVAFAEPTLSRRLIAALKAGLKATWWPAPLLFCLALVLSRRGRDFSKVAGIFLLAHAVFAYLGGPPFPFLKVLLAVGLFWLGLESVGARAQEEPESWHRAGFVAIFGALFGVVTSQKAPHVPVLRIAYIVASSVPLLGAFVFSRAFLTLVEAGPLAATRLAGFGLILSAVAMLLWFFFVG